ncbi:MAG: 30S ribosomal protein S6 [Myxococcota bacterium]
MTEYETTVVVRPDVTGQQVEAALDRVRDVIGKQGGKLLEIDHWGKKKLAYPMKKHPRGIFVRTHYLGVGGLVSELERNLRLNENVLRFMTIKLEERVEAEARTEKEYVAPAYDEAEEFNDDVDDDAFDADDRDDRDDRRDDRDERRDRDEERGGDEGRGSDEASADDNDSDVKGEEDNG